ncbi:COG0795 Predicted permeases [Candidatus Pelagibacterales bacterium]|jgi:lipopolysaccharide export system permease protein
MLKSINRYIINEYIKSLFIVIAVMLSIILLINLLDEFNFFKSKKDLKFIFFIIFTILKIPNVLINLFPFIVLFGGIVFYLKIYNHNEVISLRVMGYSNIQIILIPALTSFVIGYIIVFLIVPFSSSMLRYYEDLRSEYNETKNLVFVNETGIWILDKNEKEKNIIRIEKISKDFSVASQITIYNYDSSNNFIKRIDATEGIIKDKNWQLNKVHIISSNKKNNKENFLNNYNYTSNININELKNVYKNTDTTSLLDINKEMSILEDKGYSTIDLRIRYQKLISFPIYLLAMSILSGLMIINLGKTSNYLKYGSYGVIISIIIYFLNDLSITIAKSGIISVDFSVWIPIFLIILINLVGITQVNAK